MRVAPDMLSKSTDDFGRLRALEKQIREHTPGFDFNPVVVAYELVKQDRKSLKYETDDLVDHFTYDPLLLPERVVRDAKASASSVAILTAFLYPWARPANSQSLVDPEKLDYIEKEFGAQVRQAVDETLRIRAMKLIEPVWEPNLDPKEKKELRKEYLREFKLTGLEIAGSTAPILVLGKQVTINLEQDLEYRRQQGRLYKPQKSAATARMGALFMAPLAYIAGFEEMRDQIADLAYQLRDPEGYRKTKEEIGRVANSRKIREAKRGLILEIEKQFGWKAPQEKKESDVNKVGTKKETAKVDAAKEEEAKNVYGFKLEIRPKPAYSARDKADRKEQPVSQLGDLCGARMIINKNVIDGASHLDLRTLDRDKRKKLYRDLGLEDHLVYKFVAKEMGRGNKRKTHCRPAIDLATQKQLLDEDKKPVFEWYSPRKERFDELALQEPREKDPGRYDEDPDREAWEKKKYRAIKDARFDDYLARPKISGYSGYQDTILVPRVYDEGEKEGQYVLDEYGNQELVELELQIVDEMRHEHNMTGRRAGRVYFKTDLAKYTGEVWEWLQRAKLIAGGRRKPQRRIRVIDSETNTFVDVTSNPTVAGFFAATKRECFCPEAKLYDGVHYANDDTVYGHNMVLKSGYRVCALVS